MARASLTPSEAARQAGISRSTLYRAIRSGRLSATTDTQGKPRIDAAELSRLYHLVPHETSQSASVTHQSTQDATPGDTSVSAVLVATMQGRIAALETEVDHLKRALADAQNDKHRLLGLLEVRQLPKPKLKEEPRERFAAGLGAYQRGDYATALREFRALAARGDARGQFNLGIQHAKGWGTPVDLVRAYAWWSLAAAQGHKNASKVIDAIRKKMTQDQIAAAQTLRRGLHAKIRG
jgi:excisionase family DNA binding protein